MNPIPPMPAAILLALVAAVVACHFALISDLLMAIIVLTLIVVLVSTDPDYGECAQPRAQSQFVLPTSFADESIAARSVFAASRRRSPGLFRRHAFPAPAKPSRRSLAARDGRPAGVAEAVRPWRQTLAHAMAGIRFID
jgi:hypothetical protein